MVLRSKRKGGGLHFGTYCIYYVDMNITYTILVQLSCNHGQRDRVCMKSTSAAVKSVCERRFRSEKIESRSVPAFCIVRRSAKDLRVMRRFYFAALSLGHPRCDRDDADLRSQISSSKKSTQGPTELYVICRHQLDCLGCHCLLESKDGVVTAFESARLFTWGLRCATSDLLLPGLANLSMSSLYHEVLSLIISSIAAFRRP